MLHCGLFTWKVNSCSFTDVFIAVASNIHNKVSLCAGRENLFDNQEVLQLITISFILITLMFDLGVILKGEIRCKLLSGIKGLKEAGY